MRTNSQASGFADVFPAVQPPVDTRRASAFTILELLVCVCIIALLITLLVPSIQRARYAAMASVCGANLHRLGQSMIVATENNGGICPTTLGALYTTTSTIDAKSFYCPRTLNDPLYGNHIYYGMNSFINARLSAMSIPASTVFAGDEGGLTASLTHIGNIGLSNGSACFIAPSGSMAGSSSAPDFDGLHAGAGNIAWYDGHVSREIPLIPTQLPNGFLYLTKMPILHYGYLTPVPPPITYANFSNAAKNPPAITDYYFLFIK